MLLRKLNIDTAGEEAPWIKYILMKRRRRRRRRQIKVKFRVSYESLYSLLSVPEIFQIHRMNRRQVDRPLSIEAREHNTYRILNNAE